METKGSLTHSHVLYAIYPTHLILPDFVTPIKVGEAYKSWSSPLCNFLHLPTISFLLCPNVFISTLSATVSVYVIPLIRVTSFKPKQSNMQIYSSVYFYTYIYR